MIISATVDALNSNLLLHLRQNNICFNLGGHLWEHSCLCPWFRVLKWVSRAACNYFTFTWQYHWIQN